MDISKEKKLIFWFILLVSCLMFILLVLPAFENTLSSLGGIEKTNWLWPKQDFLKSAKTAGLTLLYPDKKRVFEGEVFDGMTVDDVLVAAAAGGNFGYNINRQCIGGVDYVIDGLAFTNGKRWNCYLNDEIVGAESVMEKIINNGDKIICEYK